MKKSNKVLIQFVLFILLVIGIGYFLKANYNGFIEKIIDKYANKTDTVWVSDTIYKDTTITVKKDSLIPKYIFVLKTDTFYTKEGKDTLLKTESKLFQDTLICDKDTAELQIFTSGIKNNVDSINLRLRKSEKIITNTVTITKYIEKPKTIWNRIHIQPQITSGYDLINNKCGITCGIGVGIDLK